MKLSTFIQYGFVLILIIIGFYFLEQFHPLSLLIVGGIVAYYKGWID
ncbi:hypothetical protein [Enterococcus sp. DIV1420a]